MALGADVVCNPIRGVGDAGRSMFGTILAAAATTAAAYNSVKAVELAQKEWNLAKKYWQLAKNWMDYYNGTYAPVEDMEVQEALDLETEPGFYKAAAGRAKLAAYKQTMPLLQGKQNALPKYLVGRRIAILTRMRMAQMQAATMAYLQGKRNERAYVEARDDIRFEKQLNTVRRGRNIVGQNISFASTAAGIYGSLYDQTWLNLQSAGRYLGYESARGATAYPQTFVAPMGNAAAELSRQPAAPQGRPYDSNRLISDIAGVN